MAAAFVAAAVVPAAVSAEPTSGALHSEYILYLRVAGHHGVPADARAVVLNVTAVAPRRDGYMTVYPCGGSEPLASNLNYTADVPAVPNAVLAGIGEDGEVCITTLSTSDVVVDLEGYIPADSPITALPAPLRVIDTRERPEGLVGPSSGSVLTVPLAGVGTIPATARAVVANVTVVDPVAGGFATAYPCDQPTPDTSSVNFAAREIRPNLVVSRLDDAGRMCVFASQPAHVVVDVSAYVPAGATGFTPIDNPRRLLDTREGIGAPLGLVGPGNPVTLQVSGRAGVPSTATAAVLNVTSTESTANGFVTAYPCGERPVASNLNFAAKQDVANLALVALDSNGRVCLYANAPTQLVADVAGWFEGGTAYAPLPAPQRLFDSRRESTPRCNALVYPPVRNTIVVRSLTTGTERTLSNPAFARTERAVMAADCQGIITLDSNQYNGMADVTLRRFDGTTTALGALPPTGVGTASIDVLNDGRVIVSYFGGSYDVATSQFLVRAGMDYRPVGMARDGSIAVFVSAKLLDNQIVIFDGVTNQQLGSFDLGWYGKDPSLSKDGSFVAYGLSWDAPNGKYRELPVIVSLDGVVMDEYPGGPVPGPIVTNWLTDDEVIVCVPGKAPVIWTMYGTTRPVGGQLRTTCPTGD